MLPAPSQRLARLLPAILVAGALAVPRVADAIPIRVRGEAELRGQMRFNPHERLELRALLTDEARLPIEQGRVEVDSFGKLQARDAMACEDLPVPLLRADRPDRVAVTTNSLGELCLQWRRAPERGQAEIRFDGDAYHGAADLTVQFDRQAGQKVLTTIEFDPRPSFLDLDRERVILGGRVELRPATAHVSLRGLPVSLTGDDGAILGRASASGDGKVRFEVPTAELGPPGHAKLHLAFGGTDELDGAADSQTVTLRAVVPLRLAAPIPEVPADEPTPAQIVLEPSRGVVRDGVVEALHRGRSVGSAPVRSGQATVEIRLAPEATGSKTVTLRYLPASPWWQAGPPLTVAVAVRQPSRWGRLAWSLVLLGVAWWTLRSWRRSRRRPPRSQQPQPLTPGVHVVRALEQEPVWRGVVRDAHEGTPLPDVTLEVRGPTLETGDDAALLARCRSDDRGRFGFELAERPRAAELCATTSTHAAERRPLPSPGILQVNLLTHRRSVLRRFVSWARARGKPFRITEEPTPAQVRAIAARTDADDVERWATEVEAVAFGPDHVDEEVAERLRQAEPRAAGREPADRPDAPAAPEA